jgi:uncharacterized protein YoxC
MSKIIKAILSLTAAERSTAVKQLDTAKHNFIEKATPTESSNPLDKIAQLFSKKIATELSNAENKIRKVEEEENTSYTSEREMGFFL